MRAPLSSLRLAAIALGLGAAACSQTTTGTTVSGLQPAGENHKVHLQGGVFAPGMHCASCHAPTGFAVDFSQNPEVMAGGARFDPVTKTCSNVSCHGNFSIGTVTGTLASVAWVDTTPMSCASCHAMPPEGHPGLAANAGATTCAGCHAGTVKADGTIDVAAGLHMNGQADMTGGTCSSCHGDPARVGSMPGVDVLITSAPPSLPAGAPAWAEGAHLIHLNPDPAIAAARPTQCSECHAVPTDATHATNPPAQKVAFGPLARANGATPTFVAGTQGCAATYCHGNFNFNGVSGQTSTMIWTDTNRVGCTSCHAMPPAGHPPVASATPASCSACHPQTISATGAVIEAGTHINGRADVVALGCTGCHGDATRKGNLAGTDTNLVSSPPVASTGAAPGVVGAHLGHVNPAAATAVMAPVACAECHVVPGDSAHATNPPASPVAFGTLARSNGATPTYLPASLGCAATYCHGNFSFNGVSGSKATATWTDPAPTTCTSCHAMPPVGHVAVAAPVTAASCAACHPSAVKPDGSINLAGKGHLNGRADVAAVGCTTCHGDPNRKGNLAGTDTNLASSPPVARPNAPAYSTGAHIGHVNPTAASFLMAPIACAECHTVPLDSAHSTNPPAQKVVFGAFTRTGGATPTWTAGTAGCAATYCHGNFTMNGVSGTRATVTWTDAGPLTCTSCHAMPPAGHIAVPAPVTAVSCAACHPDAVNADGTINRTANAHLNGRADVNELACTTCHGDANRKGTLVGTDAQLASAPPVAPTGAPSYAVGAHLGHLNPTASSYLMAPIACAECHVVPADSAHATSPPASSVVFGTLSRTGGAAPSFNAGTAGCAASYCHGNFTLGTVRGANATPLWTSTAPMTCVSCHGMPPTGHPAFTGTPNAASCFQCHPQSVNSDGTIKVAGGHINGKADGGGCTSCHGDPPTTGEHGEHRRERCDACHPTGYTSTATVATFHNNGTTDIGSKAGYSCGLKGCPPGTRGNCTNTCHGRESW